MIKEYKIIRFETNPILLKGKMESFLPNSKYWNKLHSISKTYVLSKKYFPGEHFNSDIFISEMNTPKILRNCGLNILPKALEGKKHIETELIKPCGEINGKKVKAQYVLLSKKYILIDYEKILNKEKLKIAEFKRLNALINEKPVKIYDIEIINSRLKIIEGN